MTWDTNGPVVARHMPQFVGWVKPDKTNKAEKPVEAVPAPPAADNVGND